MSNILNTCKVFISNNFKSLLSSTIIVFGLSYGLSDIFPFWKVFCSLFSLKLLYFSFFYKEKEVEVDVAEVVSQEVALVEEQYKEIIDRIEEVLNSTLDSVKEYEAIFDQQVVSIDCDCGQNTFEGIFDPNNENLCECEKCGANYRVTAIFEKVLLSGAKEDH